MTIDTEQVMQDIWLYLCVFPARLQIVRRLASWNVWSWLEVGRCVLYVRFLPYVSFFHPQSHLNRHTFFQKEFYELSAIHKKVVGQFWVVTDEWTDIEGIFEHREWRTKSPPEIWVRIVYLGMVCWVHLTGSWIYFPDVCSCYFQEKSPPWYTPWLHWRKQ